MEMEFQLSGKFGFAPRVTSILNSIDDAALSHLHYRLRHPADSFHAVFSEVAQNFLALLQRVYHSIIKQDTNVFRRVNNALKHSSNCLRPVTVLIDSRPCLGYFVESATSDGTIGPSEVSHKGSYGQSTANSFNRDLRLLYRCIYLIAEALRRAVVLQYRERHNCDPPEGIGTPYDDALCKELFNQISALPQVYYSKEAGKVIPLANIRLDDTGPVLTFAASKAPMLYGQFLTSTAAVVNRDGKYKLPLR